MHLDSYVLILGSPCAANNFVDLLLNETKSCKRKLDFSQHPDQLVCQNGKRKKHKLIADRHTVV